jgi:hypothetical protein
MPELACSILFVMLFPFIPGDACMDQARKRVMSCSGQLEVERSLSFLL